MVKAIARGFRWRKLLEENRENTPVETGARGNKVTRPGGKRR